MLNARICKDPKSKKVRYLQDEDVSTYLKEIQEARFGSTSLSHHCHCSAEVVHVLTVSIQHHGLGKLLRNRLFFQDYKQDDGLAIECQVVM